MGMGLATMAVLIMSNLVISLIKNIIPDKVRIPAFIVVIASFVTIIEMLMQAFRAGAVRRTGRLHPADRGELHHSGPCRGLRLEEHAAGFGARRCGHRPGLHAVADGHRRRARILGSGAIFGISLGTADYMPLIFVLAPGGIPGAGVSDGIV